MLGVVIDIGRSRVVERPRIDNRCYTPKLVEVYLGDVNLRPGEIIKGKRRIDGWKGWEE
jgi:hypothetical protein